MRSNGIDHIWSVDVAFMEKIASQNDGYKYLLIAVDVLSRRLMVVPIKSKSSKDAAAALEEMISTAKRAPDKIWIDEGTEFEGAFAKTCKQHGIHTYHTFTETKSSFAERFVRTLKNLIYKYMYANNTERYIHQLKAFVTLINNRVNRSIGMKPTNVTKDHTEYLISLANPPNESTPATSKKRRSRAKFKVGQTVRVVLKKDVFNKGYKQAYSDEVYKIIRVSENGSEPITYWLQDIERRTIQRRFYEKQLVHYAYHEDLRRARHQRITS